MVQINQGGQFASNVRKISSEVGRYSALANAAFLASIKILRGVAMGALANKVRRYLIYII